MPACLPEIGLDVAEILGQDAAQRDIANKSPKAEVALLKSAGLLKVLGPKKYGGGEQVSYRIVSFFTFAFAFG